MTLLVCDECVRALALIGPRDGIGLDTSFNTIARHPESGTGCASAATANIPPSSWCSSASSVAATRPPRRAPAAFKTTV